MTITLDRLAQAIDSASLEAACWRQPHFTTHVLRSRSEGHPFRDFVYGTLDAVLERPEGEFSLRIRSSGRRKRSHICEYSRDTRYMAR